MFHFYFIPLGSGGIARCVRCEAAADEAAPAEDVLARIATLPEGARAVALGGFEPFTHPALPPIIAAACERGARRILLQTDGGALAAPDNAYGVIGAGVRVFELGYRAGEAARHDELCGRAGLAEARARGIALLRELEAADPALRLTLIGVARLCRHNAAELPGIAAAAAREGLDGLRIEAAEGLRLDAAQLQAAYELLLPAGVLLFGDGCERLLGGARPYALQESW